MSDCISGTSMSAQSTQMRRVHASHRGISSRYRRRSSNFVYALYDFLIAEKGTDKVQAKSGESAKNDDLWLMPYNNGSLINDGNNNKIIMKSYKPIKKGKIYMRSTHCKEDTWFRWASVN